MIGKTVCSRYQIIEHLGTGGMATVWLAEDTILERKVAIKTFRIDAYDEEAIKRFNREANAVTSLSHPNIVSIYGVENEGNFYYLILEYVEGTTLKEYMLQNKNIPVEIVVSIIKQIADGLSHAHRNGIIHRDIKPQNILLTKELMCKITDFGISRAYGDTTLTQTNQMLGTVYYLSPEQARGNVATAQSDIYSLGILMYELLTSKIPFKGESAVAIALKHLQEELPDINKYRTDIPQSVKNIIIKATMKNPNERYLSSKEFFNDLETCLDKNRLDETAYKGFAILNNNYDIPKNKPSNNLYQEYEEEYEEYYEIAEEDKKIQNSSKYYKEEREKKSYLGKILLVLTLLIGAVGTTLFAYNYFTTASRVSMPDVKNLDLEEAKNKIIESGLSIGNITEVASDTVKENVVISTDPSSGKKVAKGLTVDIKVSSGKKTIDMPNYLGMTENQVKVAIEKVGFKSVTFEKSDSDEYAEGKVMAQNVNAGNEIVPKETSIVITISTGTKKIKLPELEGKTLTEATLLLENLGLKINVSDRKISTKYSENIIISQSQKAGSEVSKGDTISVVVSSGSTSSSDNKVKIINFVGMNYQDVYTWAENNNILIDGYYDSNSTKPSGTVLTQSIQAGTSVSEGVTITITISK